MSKNIKKTLSKLHPTMHVMLAILLFIISLLLSKADSLQNLENSIFSWVYNLPEFLSPVFISVTLFGSIYCLAILAAIFVFKKKFNELVRLILTSVLAYELTGFAKDLWGGLRPNEILLDIVSRDYYRGPGFPSGHVALATAMAFVVGHYLPKKYRWVVAVWIIGVGLSRIYLGVHLPFDIIGGFAIGWFSYMLIRHVRLYPIKYGNRTNNAKLSRNSKVIEKKSKKTQ